MLFLRRIFKYSTACNPRFSTGKHVCTEFTENREVSYMYGMYDEMIQIDTFVLL